MRSYRHLGWIQVAFVTVLICSNLIGAAKVCEIGGFTFGAAVLFFPLSYLLGDVLTEVYGYARARQVVWAGFGAMIFVSAVTWLTLRLPPAPGWPHQAAYETVFGVTPRIVLGSLLAFLVGEFANSYVLAKMKLWTEGRHLWTRTIGSTIVGEALDSLIFYPVAFYGIWPDAVLLTVMVGNYLFKVLWETAFTPLTYWVVHRLKKSENEDYYDRNTRFTPFSLSGEST